MITDTMYLIYGPNDDDVTFFNKLSNEIGQVQGENMIIVSDFNEVLYIKIDKEGE